MYVKEEINNFRDQRQNFDNYTWLNTAVILQEDNLSFI